MPLIIAGVLALIPLILGLLKGIFSVGAFVAISVGINTIAGGLISSGIDLQNILLDPQRVTVIQTVWTLMRDFVNIFFILILLVIAFATIFNVKDYKASDLLPKLVIAALLINFSMVIASEIIRLFWIPASIFLNPLGQGISEKIANALAVQDLFSVENLSLDALDLIKGATGTTEIFFREIAFRGANSIINAFILSWIALIIWVRIPMLIGLILVSPIAWLGLTLPAIRKQSWNAWWQKLLSWASIPIPLFALIYFVIFFNERLKAFVDGLGPAFNLATAVPGLGLPLGRVVIWIVTVGLFFAGLMYMKSLSASMYSWITAGFFGTWKGVRRGVSATTDFLYAGSGAAGAVGKVQKDFKEGGIPIFGRRMFGATQREAREAKTEDWLRTQAGLGPPFVAQRDTVDKAEKETRNIENRFKQARSTAEETAIIDELRTKVARGAKDPETLAAINALAKKGQLDVTLFNQAVANFKDMPLALTKVFSEWKEGKFGGIKAEELIPILRDARTPLEAKRIGYNFAASDDGKRVIQDRSFDSAAFETMYETLGGRNTKAGREAKKFVGEINPVVTGEYNFNNPTTEFDDPADYPTDIVDAILKQIKKTGSKDFTKYGKEIWNNPDFKSALGDLLYNKATTDIGNARKYAEEVRKWLIRESKDVDELRVFNDAATMAGI